MGEHYTDIHNNVSNCNGGMRVSQFLKSSKGMRGGVLRSLRLAQSNCDSSQAPDFMQWLGCVVKCLRQVYVTAFCLLLITFSVL